MFSPEAKGWRSGEGEAEGEEEEEEEEEEDEKEENKALAPSFEIIVVPPLEQQPSQLPYLTCWLPWQCKQGVQTGRCRQLSPAVRRS
jgi:hypothetical protein